MPVSDAECRTMFRLSAQALTDEEIAVRLDREPPTVARHAQGNCHHVQPLQPAAALTEATLTAHLTDLADELQEIPTQALWDRWPGRICSASTVCTKMGEWNAALTAAGFPTIPPEHPGPDPDPPLSADAYRPSGRERPARATPVAPTGGRARPTALT
jgi:hypothetical protein